MHSLLRRQLRRFLGEADGIPESLRPLIASVDEAYRGFDEDRVNLERSLDLSSTELLAASAKMRALLKALPDLVLHVDARDSVKDAKGGGGSQTLVPEEFQARALAGLAPPVGPSLVGALEEMRRTGRPALAEYSIESTAGRSFYEARAVPLRDGESLLIVRDVTSRTRLEEQVRASQRMEAVGMLAGGVAHDFNNLLGIIAGYVEMAQARIDLRHDAQEDLQHIAEASQRAVSLTRQLLAFSRRQVLRVRPLDLDAAVGRFLAMVTRLVGEDVEVAVTRATSPLLVRADPSQVDQVLLNLVVNARQAMPSGGRLKIACFDRELDAAGAARMRFGRTGKFGVLEISDTGVGMEPATVQRIFEPFFTTKASGTGMGLATVYGIVQQHAGFIEVTSTPGMGSTFRVHLPTEEVSEVSEEPPRPAAETLAGSETLLLVEDDEMLRRMVSIQLAGLGYRVLAAADGEEGVQRFTEAADTIDLVVMDTVMPKLGGPEALKHMRRVIPDLGAVLMSGYAPDSAPLQEILREPRVLFLAKPVPIATLAAAIRDLLVSVECGSEPNVPCSRQESHAG